jgi:hypothetical protein
MEREAELAALEAAKAGRANIKDESEPEFRAN